MVEVPELDLPTIARNAAPMAVLCRFAYHLLWIYIGLQSGVSRRPHHQETQQEPQHTMNSQQTRQIVAIAMFGLAIFLYISQQKKTQEQAAATAVASAAAVVEAAPKGPDPARPGARDVFVAKQNLDPALVSRLTTDFVELRQIPDSIPLPDQGLLVKSLDQIQNKVLVQPIVQGEILLRSRFGDARLELQQKKLRDVIPSGLRAISVDTDPVTGSAGFISQGDIVDVVATYTAAGKQLTRMVLQNVEVLARGNEYRSNVRPTNERVVRGDAGAGVLFTLKVTPAMAVKVAHMVDERGFNRFRLVLKNRDDKLEFRSQGTRLVDVLSDVPRPLLRPNQQAEEATPEIEILRGGTSTRESNEERGAGPPPAARKPGAPAPGRGQDSGKPFDPDSIFDKVQPINQDGAPTPPSAPPPEELRDDSPRPSNG